MSGRGRGRGKYTPPTGSKLMLMKAAEASGFDSRNLRRLQEANRPELFPDISLHSSGDQRLLKILEQQKQEEEANKIKNGLDPTKEDDEKEKKTKINVIKRSAQTAALISKGRELQHRMQNSVFYVRSTKNVPDVIRYSDATKPPPRRDASAVLSYCLGGRTRTEMGMYVPEELVSGQKLGGLSSIDPNSESLIDLERNERLRQRTGSTDQAEGGGLEDDSFDGNNSIPDEEEEDDEDYKKNYYESEGDDSDGGDNEATF